jgi:hypothetical protein
LQPVHAVALALAAARLAVDLQEAEEEGEVVVDWTLHPKWFSAEADLPVGAAVADFQAGPAPADPEELRRSF